MTDSNSFTSLLDLVNNHLAKCSLENKEEAEASLSRPKCDTNVDITKTLSTSFGNKTSPIYDVLNKQISNMLKATRKDNEQNEQLTKEKFGDCVNDSIENKNDSYVIDLVGAIEITPNSLLQQNNITENKCNSDLPMLNLISLKQKSDNKTKPGTRKFHRLIDVDGIVKRKMKHGKPSPMAKVIGARVRPATPPSWTIQLKSFEWYSNPEVKRFDFSIRSPCDCLLKFKRRPTTYSLPTNIKYDDLNLDPDRIFKQTADDFVLAMQ